MAIFTNIRSVRMIQSVTGVSFSVEHHRNPALELCSMCGRKEVCETFGRMMGCERENPRSPLRPVQASPAGSFRSAAEVCKC